MREHRDLARFPRYSCNPPTPGLGTAVGHPKNLSCHKSVVLISVTCGEMATSSWEGLIFAPSEAESPTSLGAAPPLGFGGKSLLGRLEVTAKGRRKGSSS